MNKIYEKELSHSLQNSQYNPRIASFVLKGWFLLGVNCRRNVKNPLFLYLVLCACARI